MLRVEPLPPAGHVGDARPRCLGGFVRRRCPAQLDEQAVGQGSEGKIALVHEITRRSEIEARQVELIGLAGRNLRDREILNREAR